MNRSRFSTLAAAAAALATEMAMTPKADAAVRPVVFDGSLIGFDGIEVDGRKYEVRFAPSSGNAIAVFGTIGGKHATNALAFELQTLATGVNASPLEILGCGPDVTRCRIVTPVRPGSVDANSVAIENILGYGTQVDTNSVSALTVFPIMGGVSTIIVPGASTDYAVWTAVPEPTTMTLVGLGLAGAAARGALRKKKPA